MIRQLLLILTLWLPLVMSAERMSSVACGGGGEGECGEES